MEKVQAKERYWHWNLHKNTHVLLFIALLSYDAWCDPINIKWIKNQNVGHVIKGASFGRKIFLLCICYADVNVVRFAYSWTQTEWRIYNLHAESASELLLINRYAYAGRTHICTFYFNFCSDAPVNSKNTWNYNGTVSIRTVFIFVLKLPALNSQYP